MPARKGLPEKKKKKLLDAKTWERDGKLVESAAALRAELGGEVFEDHNLFRVKVDAALKKLNLKLAGPELKFFLRAVSWRVETAPPVVAKVHKPGKATADPLRGRYETTVAGKKCVVEHEPDTDLRDTEQVPLLEEGGVEAFLAAKYCRTRRMPGGTSRRPRSAMRSASLAISTSRNRCARSRRFGPIFWRERRKPRACSPRSWEGIIMAIVLWVRAAHAAQRSKRPALSLTPLRCVRGSAARMSSGIKTRRINLFRMRPFDETYRGDEKSHQR